MCWLACQSSFEAELLLLVTDGRPWAWAGNSNPRTIGEELHLPYLHYTTAAGRMSERDDL